MIRLSNGHKVEFLVSSGAMGYDGKGWPWEWPWRWLGILRPEEFTITIKTLTLNQRKGNLKWHKPWGVIHPLGKNNWVNTVGLTNPGIEWWIKKIYPKLKSNLKIIVSIFPEKAQECGLMCSMLNTCKNITAIEINASCPNIYESILENEKKVIQICSIAKHQAKHPLILKIGYSHSINMIQTVSQHIEAIHAINSVPWPIVFPNKKSPLENYGGGGVSGPIIAEFSRKKVSELVKKTNLSIIAGGGIASHNDIKIFQQLGAKACSIGSAFFRPWKPNRIIK